MHSFKMSRFALISAVILFTLFLLVAEKASASVDPDISSVMTAQGALANYSTGILHPAQGTDANVVTMAQAIVNDATVQVTILNSSNAHVDATTGAITYDATAETNAVTFHLAKNAASADQSMSVVVPQAAPDYVSIFGDIKSSLSMSQHIETNLDACAATPTACAGLYFEKVGKGKVLFEQTLDLTSPATISALQSIGTALEMTAGHVKFDSATAAAMNAVGARVFLEALPYENQPTLIVKNDAGTVLDAAGIVSDIQYTDPVGACEVGKPICKVLSFAAAHFTQFDAQSTEAYVDATVGNDANDGTQAHPVQTIRHALTIVPAGGTVNVYPGNYNLVKDDITSVSGQTGWYLAITKRGVTIRGVTASGAVIVNAADAAANIYSTQETPNGAWATQNLITVFADDVTIQGVVVMNKISPNKGVEVLGNNFKAQYDRFEPVSVSLFANAADYHDPSDNSDHNDITKYGSGVYFNNNGASAARTGTVTDSTFKNSGVTFDSFGSNWTVTVSNNTFDGNRSWSYMDGASMATDYYSSIGATTWANQPDFTGSKIDIHENAFINMGETPLLLKIKTGMIGTFSATKNWWGTDASSTIAARLSAGVVFSPWYADAAMTKLMFATEAGTASSGADVISDEVTTSSGGMTYRMAADTTITGGEGWDGVINPPTVTTTYTLTPDSGYTASPVEAIEIGVSDRALTFDKAVKIVFLGQAGKLVGWSRGGVFTKITAACSGNNQEAGDALPAGGDCKMDTEGDLVVWTKHFTSYIVYTQTQNQSSGGGGGGGGNGPVVGSFGLVLPQPFLGRVLGAASSTVPTTTGGARYVFSHNFGFGTRGQDVTELHKILIANGMLHIAAPTGYFGPLTRAAVKTYQSAHGIVQTGYVGVLTRQVLNK